MKRKSKGTQGKQVKRRVALRKDVTARKNKQGFPLLNLLLCIAFWAAMVAVFYSGRLLRPQVLTLGQEAPDTIVATVDFEAESIAATELNQRAAAEKILPVFSINNAGLLRAQQALSKLIPKLKSLRITSDSQQLALIENSINDVRDFSSISLSTEELLQILPEEMPDLQAIILETVSDAIQTGIMSSRERMTGINGASIGEQITVLGEKTETIRELNSFIEQSVAQQQAVEKICTQLPQEQRNETVVRALIAPWLQANLVYNATETAARRTQAKQLVEPVLEPIQRGSILIRSGDIVSTQTLRWLTAHEQRLSDMETLNERIQRLVGSGLLQLLGLALTAAFTGILCRPLLRDRRKVLLMLALAALPLLIGKLLLTLTVTLSVLPPSILDYTIPLALAPILASVLLGSTPGLIIGFWVGFSLSALYSSSFEVLILSLMVSVTAVYTTRDVKKRGNLFRAGLWIGIIKILLALILAVINRPSWWVLLPQLGAALASGLICSLLAILLIPFFEHLFKVTTDITLLELSDLSHPLLQSLALNAPGTYHHSLMLASLAQNAAEAIGANGLMLRVCAYFHDIGKLVKPGFFTENIQFSENPHDDLSPSMSTLVIVSHIKEGVTLARKHKLPQVIIDGIQQHQGTSLVSVFYHRAKSLQQKETATEANPAGQCTVNDEDFRYEGPRPQNREMAILMLADSCEAASRSLDKPTPVRIRNLISDIFYSRIHDHQLDECSLTFADLNTVKHSFIFSLTNMLHGRIPYPKEGEKDSNADNSNKA